MQIQKGVNMIELVLLACLVDKPDNCRDVGLMYSSENLTPMQCMMQAPPYMAKWVGEHPGWKVMKWTCRRAGRYAKT